MGLKLKKCEKILKNTFKDFGFDCDTSYGDSFVKGTTSITFSGVDDDILLRVEAHEDEALYIALILDKLEVNEQTIELMNKFNEEALYLKSFVNDQGYLYFYNAVPNVTEDLIEQNLIKILNEFASDELDPIIKELASLTVGQ